MGAHLEAIEHSGVATVHLCVAWPDTVDPDQLNAEMTALVSRLPEPTVQVDLAGVAILTSSHLGMLLRLRQELSARGRRLKLARLSPHVRDLLHATRLDAVFDIAADMHAVTNRQQIEHAAYCLWLQRGRPDGSPLDDWVAAERSLAAQTADAGS